MIRKASIVVGLVVAMAATLPGGTGFAGTEAQPEVSDIAGDANLVNGNGQGPDVNLGTAPASLDSADIRAMWLETAYDKVITTVDGVRRIHHEPKALVLKVKTTAPAKPTFGPSLIFRLPALIDGACNLQFELWIRGSAPGAVNREYAALNRLGCTGGVTTLGTSLTFAGNVMTATFPFAPTAGTLANGKTVDPYTRAHVRVVAGADTTYCCTAPVIDEAPVGATSFTIGSDVPPDVDCSQQPTYPDCA